jgi:L-lactate dehydrogenase (cytochrome)
LQGFVYDVTDFLQLHPGGVQAIVAQAGKDASKLFTMLHPPDALGTLPTEYCLGPVDPETLPAQEEEELSEAEQLRQQARENMPPAENMVMVQDFEDWAQKVLSETAWAYYRSAADEEMSEFLVALSGLRKTFCADNGACSFY